MERNFGIKVNNNEEKVYVLTKLQEIGEKIYNGFSVYGNWKFICYDIKFKEWSLCEPGLDRYKQDYYITAEEFLLDKIEPQYEIY